MLVRGPFTLKWGDNTLNDVEEITIDHTIASDDLETLNGRTYEIDGSYKATATITLLATDLAALAILLPQHFVPNGGVLSTGETVNNAQGAIDVAPHDCDTSLIYNHLDIISCANPSQTTRLVNARTKIDGISIDNKIQKVMIKFVGEAAADDASVQFFKTGSINVVS